MKLPKENEVHVWRVLVAKTLPSLPAFLQVLSSDEEAKAARFRRVEDRNRSIVSRGVLRHLMGGYLSAVPRELTFIVNAFGKPALAQRSGYPPVQFNLAHSGDVVLCAVTLNRLVGVDVELMRADLNVGDLARSHFSAQEIDALERTPPREKVDAFFRCWTRKEACVKAWGQGLSFPLDKFAVTLRQNEAPQVAWLDPEAMPEKKWSMFHLEPGPGYLGAVVVEGQDAHLISSDWTFSPAADSANL